MIKYKYIKVRIIIFGGNLMKNFSSWLIAMFAFMFWGLRLVGTVMTSLGESFMFEPTDLTMEVVLLFITFICICFIIKRKLLASIIYLVAHLFYYGPSFYTHFIGIINNNLEISNYMTVFLELIGIVLPLAAVFDVLLDKNRKAHPTDKKTDWFYKNEEYDRKLDDRADKNNYRTL